MVLPEDPGEAQYGQLGVEALLQSPTSTLVGRHGNSKSNFPKDYDVTMQKKENLCDIIQCGSPQIVNLFCNHNNQGL